MGHLERRPGDTVQVGAWWYRDEDDFADTKAEYDRPEYHDDDRAPEDDDE